jgi:hypothetical protein
LPNFKPVRWGQRAPPRTGDGSGSPAIRGRSALARQGRLLRRRRSPGLRRGRHGSRGSWRNDRTGVSDPGYNRTGHSHKKTRRAGARRVLMGGGCSPRTLSRRRRLALSLSRAVCSPTPLNAASVASVSWRDRPGRCRPGMTSEASLPGSTALCRARDAGQGADTPTSCGVRVGTVATGTAPAFGRALAPCDGSDLLPRWLRWLCSWVTRFVAPPQVRSVCRLCQTRSLPALMTPFARPPVRAGLLAGWPRRASYARAGVL